MYSSQSIGWGRGFLFVTVALAVTVGVRGTGEAGSIVGTPHDFSAESWSGGQVCVVCHAPHNTDTTVVDAPLWNHDLTSSNFTLYASATLDARLGQPTGISKLCLSCHDGTVAVDSFGGDTGSTHIGDLAAGTNTTIGTELNNDHPVSFAYTADLARTDGALTDPASVTLPLFGVNKNQLECATCHDVHDNDHGDFLRGSNAGSALCLTCHVK